MSWKSWNWLELKCGLYHCQAEIRSFSSFEAVCIITVTMNKPEYAVFKVGLIVKEGSTKSDTSILSEYAQSTASRPRGHCALVVGHVGP